MDPQGWTKQYLQRWFTLDGSCACPSFCSHRRASRLTEPQGYIQGGSSYFEPVGGGVKINHPVLLCAVVLTSAQFLWFYDYFLTLGDEVRHQFTFFCSSSLSDGCTDKVCLAREEIMEWVYIHLVLTSSLMTQRLPHSVRVIPRCMSPPVQNRNGVDVTIEQVYPPDLPHLALHHLLWLQRACECLSMMLPWLLTRFTDSPQV